jgi:DNA-binding transcriptional LysR family regulator
MEFRQIRYFEAVARTLSFSRAAEILNVAQPALSRQVQQLEDELGVRLLDRSLRPLKLTNAGAFLFAQSVQIIERLDEIRSATQRLGAGGTRWMGVGFTPSLLYGALPKALKIFSDANPAIEVTMMELMSLQQVDALKTGRIDVGVGRLEIDDDMLETLSLAEEPLIAVVPNPGELAGEGEISLDALATAAFIVYPATQKPSFAEKLLDDLRARGVRPRKIHETNGLQTAIGLVSAGLGVTIVPQSVQRLSRADICYRPLSDPSLKARVIMTTRKGDASPYIDGFRAALSAAIEMDGANAHSLTQTLVSSV